MGNYCNAQVKSHSPTHTTPNNSGSKGKSSKSSEGSFSTEGTFVGNGRLSTSSNLRSYTFNDLKAATRNFRPDSLIGEGGFGPVFKGWIDEHGLMATKPGTGIVVAVKKLNLEGCQGHREWMAEVNLLGQLHHPNLVKLIGFCTEDDHRLLVYEFMPRGSLENHLFNRGHTPALSWAIRIKIAVGAARGFAFLHNSERPVIYRDFKASNILLDSQYNAKLSDFGLAKDGPIDGNSHVSTRVMGTYGYAAPEYVATGHLTAKSDVYSFGVVLLEILTGRRAVDKNRPGGEQNLVEWAKPFLSDKRKLFRVLDSRLEGQYSMKGAHKATTLALSCLSTEARLRPLMKDVVETLEPLLSSKEMAKHGNQTESKAHAIQSKQKEKLDNRPPRDQVGHPSPRNEYPRTPHGGTPLPAHQRSPRAMQK